MRCIPPVALGLLLVGCVGGGKHAVTPVAPAVAPVTAARLLPSPLLPVGRVLAVDERVQTVIVDISPYAQLPASLTGLTLLVRDAGDLHPTARLQASSYLRGRTLGTRILAGQPVVGDEVVLLPPEAPREVAPPTPPAADTH